MKIRRVEPADFPAIRALLVANDLPDAGLESLPGEFVVAEDGLDVIGVAGVEDCGGYGLLRSVAVDAKWRSHGVGRRLVDRLIEDARRQGKSELYLLTTTAERYFPAFGFQATTRDTVPDPIRATQEFAHACPASATVMKLVLSSGTRSAL